jgi:transposase InsO family protein
MHLQNTTLTHVSKTLVRHHVLSLVAGKYLTVKQAAKELGLSTSHAKRLWRLYRDGNGDVDRLAPRVRIRPSPVLTGEVRQKIAELATQYPDWSCLQLTERLNQDGIAISRETVRLVLHEARKDAAQKSGATKPSTRFEAKTFGEIVQMDTCEGAWLQGSGYQYLIACLDDHSRFVVSAAIFSTDSTWTNMCAIRQMVENWGLPGILYTDNASHFKVVRHKDIPPWHDPKRYRTRIQDVLTELGITHLTHHPFNPRAKGKIERFFRFIQGRLFKDHTARNLAELNFQLYQWLKWYNFEHVNRVTKQKPCDRTSPSSFRSVPADMNLDRVFVIKETRWVNKDNSFSFRGTTYFIPEQHHVAGCKVDVHLANDYMRVYHQGTFLIELKVN